MEDAGTAAACCSLTLSPFAHPRPTPPGTPDARRASLQLLAALVQEFTPATASSLGLPWDHHERCRADMETAYLQVGSATV